MKVQSAGIGQPGHAHTAQGGVRAQSGADPNVQIPLCVYKSSVRQSIQCEVRDTRMHSMCSIHFSAQISVCIQCIVHSTLAVFKLKLQCNLHCVWCGLWQIWVDNLENTLRRSRGSHRALPGGPGGAPAPWRPPECPDGHGRLRRRFPGREGG